MVQTVLLAGELTSRHPQQDPVQDWRDLDVHFREIAVVAPWGFGVLELPRGWVLIGDYTAGYSFMGISFPGGPRRCSAYYRCGNFAVRLEAVRLRIIEQHLYGNLFTRVGRIYLPPPRW